MSKQFYFKKFSLLQKHSLVLFDLKIEPYLRVRVGLGAIAI